MLFLLIGCSDSKTDNLDNDEINNQDDDIQETGEDTSKDLSTQNEDEEIYTLDTKYHFEATEEYQGETSGTEIYLLKNNKVEVYSWKATDSGTNDVEFYDVFMKFGTYTIKDNKLNLKLTSIFSYETEITEKIKEERIFDIVGNNQIQDGSERFGAVKGK